MMRGMNRYAGSARDNIDHVRQSIVDILTTRIGTRVMRRDYGSRLPELIDHPINDGIKVDLFAATAIAIDRWEPRVRLTNIGLQDAYPGGVVLTMEMLYLPEGREITLDGIVVE